MARTARRCRPAAPARPGTAWALPFRLQWNSQRCTLAFQIPPTDGTEVDLVVGLAGLENDKEKA